MGTDYNLQRFLDAQEKVHTVALSEIKQGRKKSHWMWFIFPQIKGLGFSETSQLYAIENIQEAEAFLKHPILGSRLINISNELLRLASNNATGIFGSPDDKKLQSSMTLFSLLPDADLVFTSVLQKFFNGMKDKNTLKIVGH